MVIKRLNGIGSDTSGSTVVEFALIVPIFLAIMFSILEAGWFFFVNSAVDQANASASRLIRTGQVQSTGISREDFFDEVCDIVDIFGDCAEQLTVDVSQFSSFSMLAADLNAQVCRDSSDAAVDGAPFDAGVQRDIVRVRVCFLYKPLTPGIGLNLDASNQGFRKIFAVSIFRNEPFK